MSTMNDEQERNTPELTNLIDVVAAETGNTETKANTEPEVVVEAATAVEEAVVVEETAVIETVVTTTEETAVESAVEETVVKEETIVEEKPIAPPKPQKWQKKQKKQRQKRNSAVTSRDVKSWFASCGRCGFFLSAYGLLETTVDLETAVSRTKGDWLALDWNPEIRNLVNKSYGCVVDTGIYHLDTACPECRRRFVLHAGGDNRSFRIALNPAIKR